MKYRHVRIVVVFVALIVTLLPAFPVAGQASPAASPVAIGPFDPTVVGGDGVHFLEPAPEGEVRVIAMGALEGNQLPIIVHNNSDESIGRVEVDAVIFGDDRVLLGVASAGVGPGRIDPGGLGMTTLSFDDEDYPSMVSIETLLHFESSDPNSSFDPLFPTLGGWVRAEDRVAVMLRNGQDEPIADPALRVACFTEDGTLNRIHWEPAEEDLIPVGEQIRILETFDAAECHFVIFIPDGDQN